MMYLYVQKQIEQFAEWVAKEVCNEDFKDRSFAEVACRKLYRMGFVTVVDDKWVVIEEDEE